MATDCLALLQGNHCSLNNLVDCPVFALPGTLSGNFVASHYHGVKLWCKVIGITVDPRVKSRPYSECTLLTSRGSSCEVVRQHGEFIHF